MNIALRFTYHTDIISVPDEVGMRISKYQQKFDKWLYNEDNENWIIKNGQKYAVSFDTGTFIDYLNTFCINDSHEKAFIVKENATEIPAEMPTLFF